MRRDLFGKLLAVGVLLLLPCLLWMAVVEPVLTTMDRNKQAIESRANALKRWSKGYSRLKLQLDRSRSKDIRPFQQHFFTAENDNLVAAKIQTTARAILSRHSATLRSAQILRKSVVNQREYLGMRLQFEVSLRQLQLILHGIQTHQPLLFLNQLFFKNLWRIIFYCFHLVLPMNARKGTSFANGK